MKELKINHGAVWVIVVLGQVIPAFWYGIFAEQWMSLNGFTEEEAMSGGYTPYVVSIITAIAFGYMLAWVFVRMNVSTWIDGLKTGFIMGFPIAILGTMTMYMFSLQPYALTWIDGGQNLIIWTISGAILGGWTKTK
ncbi:MAG: DUF1761 domain-containing protein [Bacteroidota bacterium]